MRFEVRGSREEVRGRREALLAPETSYLQPRTSNLEPHKRAIVALLIALALLAPEVANACSVCYGAPGNQMTKAADNGTLFLLGIVVFVQLGFIALFVTLWRRAKALRRHRDQFHVIHGGVR